jgi:hypothetical protein
MTLQQMHGGISATASEERHCDTPTSRLECPRPALHVMRGVVGRRTAELVSREVYRPHVSYSPLGSWRERMEASAHRAGMRTKLLSQFGGWLVCCGRYEVHDTPVPHEGSGALYHIDGQIVGGTDALFVYELPSGARTSQHTHRAELGLQAEDYYLIHGEARVAGEPLGSFMRTYPGEDHQVVAGETGAIVAAVLRGAAAVPRAQWHTRL